MSSRLATALGRRPGRPRKFPGPSRAVTATLPEGTVDTLRAIDPDLSRAIVGLAERVRPPRRQRPAAQLRNSHRSARDVSPLRRTIIVLELPQSGELAAARKD